VSEVSVDDSGISDVRDDVPVAERCTRIGGIGLRCVGSARH